VKTQADDTVIEMLSAKKSKPSKSFKKGKEIISKQIKAE